MPAFTNHVLFNVSIPPAILSYSYLFRTKEAAVRQVRQQDIRGMLL
jgi:hypothetical protein